jgi:hypothetical protein
VEDYAKTLVVLDGRDLTIMSLRIFWRTITQEEHASSPLSEAREFLWDYPGFPGNIVYALKIKVGDLAVV